MTAAPFADGFADRLRKARERAGLTQRELGAEAEVNYSQVSRYEQGIAFPRPGVLLRLAKATGVSPEYLRGGAAAIDQYPAPTGWIRASLPADVIRAFENEHAKSGTPVDVLIARLEKSWVKLVREHLRDLKVELESDTAQASEEKLKRKRKR